MSERIIQRMSTPVSNGFSRYARQIVLPEVGVNGQQLLQDSSVLIVGIGGLGSVASLYLAGAGIGRLLLTDRDRIELSNLQRQILYRQGDIGRQKTEASAEHLKSLNPEVDIQVLSGPLDETGLLSATRGVDLVLDCSDNFSTRFAVNRVCVNARKPLVSAAAIRFEGQLAVFDCMSGGPCYGCLYPESGEAQETCEESGVLGPVVGAVGAMQALLAIRHLLGIGDDAGRLHLWNALKMAWRQIEVPRDPVCRVCAGR